MPASEPQAEQASKKRVISEFPKYTLEEALRVPAALDRNGGRPLAPLETAIAMGLSPGSSVFRGLLSASIKYGLTKGTEKASTIELLPAGESINAPKAPEEKTRALIAAALNPPKFAAIYEHYKNSKFPEGEFLANTIIRQFGIPAEHAGQCAEIFAVNMHFVALLRETPGGIWLGADAAPGPPPRALESVPDPEDSILPGETDSLVELGSTEGAKVTPDLGVNTRVFITHGSNMKIVDQVKELLVYGKFEPIVAVERHSVSKPVPDKVLDEMRSCAAAVIHVGAERQVVDSEGEEQTIINSNVLIEIGAAMALYGRNFILLVERGTKLPSNLQGLYEVRYEGEGLDHEATMNLLKSFNDFQK